MVSPSKPARKNRAIVSAGWARGRPVRSAASATSLAVTSVTLRQWLSRASLRAGERSANMVSSVRS